MSRLPQAAEEILERGVLCYLASPSPAGPHTTPVVFAVEGGRIWGTTGRRTTKAKLWKRAPVAGGLVRSGDRALAFRGEVRMYDLLDPGTWASSLLRSRQLTMAAARFTAKNARFFAGYARDAAHVPLTWTPPARILFSVDLTDGAVLSGGEVTDRWGGWGSTTAPTKSFRDAAIHLDRAALPDEVADLLDRVGDAVVALPHAGGPVVVPGEARPQAGVPLVRVPRAVAELADANGGNATVVLDRASAWRASKMRGLMLRGPASVFVPSELTSGKRKLEAAFPEVGDDVVVRVRPRSAVWWVGWSSGTVAPS